MARKGGRVDLASLATSVGDRSPVDVTVAPSDGHFRANVPLTQLVANPRNPRAAIRNLDDLESIKFRQLQPGTVVSRSAWLALWPEDEQHLDQAQWVVVNGCRRLAAARKFGRDGLDVVIRDSLAADRETVLWAAVVENIDREDFDVLEEAHAVELMVAELGGAGIAAKRLGRSEGWVSQRRALLKLAPELQESLRAANSLCEMPDRWPRCHKQTKSQPGKLPRSVRSNRKTIRRASPLQRLPTRRPRKLLFVRFGVYAQIPRRWRQQFVMCSHPSRLKSWCPLCHVTNE
ncbi:peptide transporter [Williamsia sp. DF01-3]|uniref:ParB/RepB/Spo0J family partition protein n=1 Tax=Williamsia sp. DF01-3 TaxID=2934157 RepID=UPI0027E36215|nr:peptide transporter [Williamsia sp. DF01-3]